MKIALTWLLGLLALGAAACGSDADETVTSTTSGTTSISSTTPASPTAPVSSVPPGDVIGVADLFDGEGPRTAMVEGFVLWDQVSARLCAVLMESFPPQCGNPAVVIANPADLPVELQSEQEVRWTDVSVVLDGRFDGDRLILANGSVEPTGADQALIGAFFVFAEEPSAELLAKMPLADEVAIGLGSEIERSVARVELADPSRWDFDPAEGYAGFDGPFSALAALSDPARWAELVKLTVGAHNHCAGPPKAAPSGFEDLRRLSLQPTGIDSCIDWFTVDFFIDDDGLVNAITLDLFGP